MKLQRTFPAETKVLDAKQGLVEYVASDESLDRDREVVRIKGWRFDNFKRYSPFLDSHRRGSIDAILGRVVDFAVKGGRLVEVVEWAINAGLPEDHLANVGFKLTQAGYLKAVSVGFEPVRYVSKYGEGAPYLTELRALGLDKLPQEQWPYRIFLEQQQTELSAVTVPANANALAKAYKDGLIPDTLLESISKEYNRSHSTRPAPHDAPPGRLCAHQQRQILEKLNRLNKSS